MSQQTQTKQSELLNTQQNTPQQEAKENCLITNEEIPNTPFRMVGNDETGYSAAIRNYMLTKPMPTKDECLKALERNKWTVHANMIIALTEIIEQEKNNTQKLK